VIRALAVAVVAGIAAALAVTVVAGIAAALPLPWLPALPDP
jgi:thiol:disulfide interchange protein